MSEYKHYGHSHFGMSRQDINSMSHRKKVERKRARRAFIAPVPVYRGDDAYISKGWGRSECIMLNNARRK